MNGKLTQFYKCVCCSQHQVFCCYFFLLGKKTVYIHLINVLYSVFNDHEMNVPTLQASDADTSWFSVLIDRTPLYYDCFLLMFHNTFFFVTHEVCSPVGKAFQAKIFNYLPSLRKV